MCGIVGLWGHGSVEPMLKLVEHRGPDEEGIYKYKNIQLGVRRLNIIDLVTGSQPIYNEDGTKVIVYNGEVFNHKDIRIELQKKGHIFKTNTDTEVILHAYEQWGYHCLDRFIGQFAFCIFDETVNTMFTARDRMGEKPLYYYLKDGNFYFASEIKAILSQVKTEIVVDDYFWAFESFPEGHTLYKDIHELPPATYMVYNGDVLTHTAYWRIPNDYTYEDSEEVLTEQLRELVIDAIKIRMIADVPVGIALSGGLDSAIVACVAKPDIAFSCRFPLGEQYDEWHYASLIAKKVKCEHVTVTPDIYDVTGNLQDIMWFLDQPVATASPLGDFAVAEAASKRVKVLLGGQGSDECLGGYIRYLIFGEEMRLKEIIILENYLSMMRYFWDKDLLSDPSSRYFKLLCRGNCLEIDRHIQTVKKYYDSRSNWVDATGYTDIHLTLPSLIQMNDRSSSAYGIENRNPFLDHRFIEFCYRLPAKYKINGYVTKYLLRRAFRGIVPDEVLNRTDKKGLIVPIWQWLDSKLLTWKKDYLDSLAQRIAIPGGQLRSEFDRSEYSKICLEMAFRNFETIS